jgi:hypothetical protein
MPNVADVDNQSPRERLIGSWKLVSYEARSGDGQHVIHPLGKDAKGYILDTPDGYMSAQIMQPDRPPHQVDDAAAGTDAEAARAARGYLAYSGPYHVEDDSLVIHQAAVSLFPNWVEHNQPRRAVLDGRRLELSNTAPIPFGPEKLTAVLMWERA